LGRVPAASDNIYLGAARHAFSIINSTLPRNWRQHDVDMTIRFCTYNQHLKMLAMVELFLQRDGRWIKPKMKTNAVPMDPYPRSFYYVVDVLYILLTLYTIWPEVKEFVSRLRVSKGRIIRTCADYWSYWNFIDWLSVVMAFANVVVWGLCLAAMKAPSFKSLLDDSLNLKPDTIAPEIGVQDMNEIFDDFLNLKQLFNWLHFCASIFTIAIFLKLFKGFEANRNLTMATDAFQRVVVDLLHFCLIFIVFFYCFAIFGHVLFGTDLPEFYTIASSVRTCANLLLMDFGWYVDTVVGGPMFQPSGMPTLVLIIWYILFVLFIVNISLNILFGIILDEVCLLWEEERRDKIHSKSLWRQCQNYARTIMRPIKGEISLTKILQTVDAEEEEFAEDEKGGPRKINKSRLGMVLPDLTHKQLEKIFTWLAQEKMMVDNHEALQLRGNDLSIYRLGRFVERIIEDVHLTAYKVHHLRNRIQITHERISSLCSQMRTGSRVIHATKRGFYITPGRPRWRTAV